jgi:hypothetical protein
MAPTRVRIFPVTEEPVRVSTLPAAVNTSVALTKLVLGVVPVYVDAFAATVSETAVGAFVEEGVYKNVEARATRYFERAGTWRYEAAIDDILYSICRFYF